MLTHKLAKSALCSLFFVLPGAGISAESSTELYWGDTHLHTSYSFDAFLSKNQSADPDTAYRWAKGLPVIHPYTRAKVQIETPLDFLVVSDHAEAMGVMRAVVRETEDLGEMSFWGEVKRWLSLAIIRDSVEDGTSEEVFNDLLPDKALQPGSDPVQDPANVFPDSSLGDMTQTVKTAWGEIVDAADRHNDPGTFTAFLGWEWSSIPTGANLHRVVISPNGAKEGRQYLPFGSDQSQYPEDLWAFLDKTARETGSEFIAIPHNSNVSKGYMFPEVTLKGQPITVNYARTRMAWEPVVEVTQIKGDSETHASLSPEDPFASFEDYGYYLQKTPEAYEVSEGDYVRAGLRRGLEIEQSIGVNPFKFGVIGSTDAHTGLSSAEEDNFWGKFAHDSTPESKRGGPILGGTRATGWNMSASGLAAAWAQENSREAIFAAFKRREVYATTGPRIKVRVFAGWNFPKHAAQAEEIASIGYSQGVPMGGDLVQSAEETPPVELLIRAVKDPADANLDRVQVVKGWLDKSGTSHEKVFNVAWSGERVMDSSGRLPEVGSTVDITTAKYTNTIGAAELATLWTDPDFDENQRAFYYVRVLQIPTPRHSLYDAVSLQVKPPEEGPAVLQERAYTSPIWYTPQ